MKKPYNLYKSISALVLIVSTMFACDRDFTSIESDIEGIKNFNTASKTFPLVAYNKKLNPVQTSGLSLCTVQPFSPKNIHPLECCLCFKNCPFRYLFLKFVVVALLEITGRKFQSPWDFDSRLSSGQILLRGLLTVCKEGSKQDEQKDPQQIHGPYIEYGAVRQ